ncbi:MAG: ribose-phosphate diphosphokinase [Polyangia bacterium]|jgi:ribose-phosphate pyrophosphokinase|nr:ribose-phosphate diphosphokinase [Polyangia bacterium]
MPSKQQSQASRGAILVFATERYGYLQREMCREMGLVPGEVERRRFPDGERYQRIRTDVTGRDVALVGGTVSDEDTLEIFDLANGLVRYGAHTLTLVIPYLGYSTMDRAVHQGEVVTAKARARLLSALPTAGSGNRIMLLDLHTEGLQHYFDGNLRPVHLHARTQVVEVARNIGGANFVLACADAGRAKWVETLANELGVVASFVFKRRITGRQTEVTAVSAQVEGRQVVIYDDMIRTGGTLLGAAKAFLDSGATQVSAIATHGVFPGDSLERLRKSGLLARIVVTDSHPRAVELRSPYLTVVSCAELLATALTRAD